MIQVTRHSPLSPIQQIMVMDSLSEPRAGHHVEQLEITFSRELAPEQVAAAWLATVMTCDALRIGFDLSGASPGGPTAVHGFPEMEILSGAPPSEEWMEADRCRPLLQNGRVPWRTFLWPGQRRWLWTFHHALLDGRSITRIMQAFLTHLEGGCPRKLTLSLWQPPSPDSLETATRFFQRMGRTVPVVEWPSEGPVTQEPATLRLGQAFADALEQQAAALKSTAATMVIAAWGQALADFLNTGRVLVEQVRAGAPQPGTAGFTMNVLPLTISRGPHPLEELRTDLLAMRRFETVSERDFPPDIYPLTATAPVIMVEHSTLPHALRAHPLLETVRLRERPAGFPSATAFLRPDLEIKVEGPHRHDLLSRWRAALESLDFGIAGTRVTAGKVCR